MDTASLLQSLRAAIESIAPGPETLARRETRAEQEAWCALLMEVARIDSKGAQNKRGAVAQALRERFGLADEELLPMIENAGLPQNRLTSYFPPVALLNKRRAPGEKAQFVERLWRVAMADGNIDMYEEQLVRTLAELLYVSHADFILAKHRAQSGGAY